MAAKFKYVHTKALDECLLSPNHLKLKTWKLKADISNTLNQAEQGCILKIFIFRLPSAGVVRTDVLLHLRLTSPEKPMRRSMQVGLFWPEYNLLDLY